MNAIHPNLSQGDFGAGKPPTLALSSRQQVPLIAAISAIALLFAVLLAAYAVLRSQLTISMPQLPWIFWPSTAVLALSTLLLQHAIRCARHFDGTRAHRALLMGTGMSYFFVGLQAPGIVMLSQLHMPFNAISPALYGLTLALVGLHLLLMIGGLAALSEASLRSEKHHYEGREARHLRPIAVYIHALTVVWLVVFAVLVMVNL